MSYDGLRLFRDIAATRSFSRAADLNGLSQSAASQQIQELEKNLAVTLLDRSRRPLVVTSAGELYADFCNDVLRRKAELDDALAGLRQTLEGTVRMATIYSVGVTEIVGLERLFSETYPNAQVQLEYLQPEKVYAAVLAERADIGLVSYPVGNRDLQQIPWRQEEMVLAAAPNHPLAMLSADTKGPIPVETLEQVNFIAFDEELPIRQHVDRFLKSKQVTVRRTLHFDNIEMIKETVEHGVGVSIIPYRSMREEIRQKRLAAIRIKGETLYRPLGIVYRKRTRLNRVARAFLDLLCEQRDGGTGHRLQETPETAPVSR